MKTNLKAALIVATTLAVGIASPAMAAYVPATDLPPDAVGVMGDLKLYVEKFFVLFWQVGLLAIGGFTVFRLVKKGAGKAI